MRIRTDARRQAIISQASAVFREHGFAGASMSLIAARCGGSKATLYGYFRCKHDLLMAVMHDATETQADAMMAIFDHVEDCPRATLIAFGHAYLDLTNSPEILAVKRIGISEGRDEAIGGLIYDQGPCRGLSMIAEHLQSWIDRGLLRDANTRVMAMHLRALLDANAEPVLYGAEPEFAREPAVAEAIDTFLRAYRA